MLRSIVHASQNLVSPAVFRTFKCDHRVVKYDDGCIEQQHSETRGSNLIRGGKGWGQSQENYCM